jgi:phage antirepressor YoqD-like protein
MNLQVIEHQGQRVLTTQQLAKVYETDTDRIHQNYMRNNERFVDGRDYYFLEGADLKAFKGSLSFSEEPSIKFAPSLLLWTSRGANRHCKILDTDKAWQQFDVLEETYFNVKNKMFEIPKSLPEALRAYANEVEAHEKTRLLLEAAQPAVDFIERYVEASALKNIREVAKILNAKERDFVQWLLDCQIVYRMGRNLLPFATYQHKGYFEVKTGEKNGFAYHQTRFTPAGVAWIAQKYSEKESA